MLGNQDASITNSPADSESTASATTALGSSPRVSVVLGIDRIDPYFPAAVASILEQSFTDFEFLLVFAKRLRGRREEFANQYRHDPRVHFLEVPSLGGLGLALNIGIGEARGEYIARMDGDDISLPHRLAEQVRFLDEHPRVAVVGGRVELIDEHDRPIALPFPYYGTNEAIRRILPIRNPMPHPAMMMRKSVLESVGGYRYGHASEDYELFLRISRNKDWEFANLDSLVLRYRRHSAQVTNTEYLRTRFAEVSGFLFTEAFRQRSPRYFLGMAALHPWSRAVRNFLSRSSKRPR